MKEKPFKTEAALCAAFIAWAEPQGVRCFAEWSGWDILLVYPDGYQVGVQAKLRLNPEVIGQASPDSYGWDRDDAGPDFRAVLVPEERATMAGLASRLGLVVFCPSHFREGGFMPALTDRNAGPDRWNSGDLVWVDWNPRRRHELPPTPTDAIAGSPCPVTLTPWKLAAMDVLAELSVKGTITTKRMRALGVNPSRWLSACWLAPGATRGEWVRAARCPKFDEQHPAAYALALKKAEDPAAATA